MKLQRNVVKALSLKGNNNQINNILARRQL